MARRPLAEQPREGPPDGIAAGSGEFRTFYEAAHGQLVAHLYALTGDLGEAQDAAQEAFIRAWNHWPRLSSHENPVAWVRLTGQRIAISRWRRARTALRSWVRHGPVNPQPGPGPESVALVAALRELPEAQRRAVVLHHMGGLTVAEIAAEEGVALGTIKARLHRGRAALAGLLGDPAAPVDPAPPAPTAPPTPPAPPAPPAIPAPPAKPSAPSVPEQRRDQDQPPTETKAKSRV
ncbi:SigE family RNA polymerase sigma factor [Kitasatospora viridis]|uniref:RNA polymerase sigma-70 factor (ECF subfamily) n=1 Tax=Kitasatospora viridis TaxID=281105 RepID=A0A561UKU1_9ACTN|nr:RNA polymerase sigma-70 factor (ECF subfamily) [Kitasatospora viridis]